MSVPLSFRASRPLPPAELRRLFEAIASELCGAPSTFAERERTWLPDEERRDACYLAVLQAPNGASLREHIESGQGNPRDGYGYHLQFELLVRHAGRPIVVRLKDWNWTAELERLPLEASGLDGAGLQRLRRLLRARLGDESDRCFEISSARPLSAALVAAGLRDEGLALAHEALERSTPDTFGRDELLAFVSKLEGGGLERRLRESPGRVDAWLAALEDPPPGFSREQVRAALDQLRPYDPAHEPPSALTPWFFHPDWPLRRLEGLPLQGFRRHEQGLGPAHSDPSVLTRIGKALLGLGQTASVLEQLDSPLLEGEHRSASVTRTVWWDASGGLRSWVQLVVHRRQPRHEQTGWSFFAGPAKGDLLLFLEKRSWPEGQGPSSTPSLHGQAAWARGSRDFLQRVETALAEASPFRWLPCDAESCFPTEPLVEPTWFAEGRTLPARAFAARILLAAPLGAQDRAFALEALASCRCPQPKPGYCPHQDRVLQASREAHARAMEHARPRRSQHELYANESALAAALVALEGRKDSLVEHYARSALQHLRLAAAIR